jgi:sporulation protein YlmC with PRC-barrel domain
MTSKVAPYLAAAAIALTLPLSALAQQGGSGSSMPGASPAPAPASPPSQSQSQTAPSGSDMGTKSATKTPFEATDLKGKDVYDAAGKKVGSIDDVIPQTGQARDAVLSVGGILGIGAKKVLVPASDIERGNEGRLVVSMTQEQLDKLPEYEAPKRDAGPANRAPGAAPGSAPSRP